MKYKLYDSPNYEKRYTLVVYPQNAEPEYFFYSDNMTNRQITLEQAKNTGNESKEIRISQLPRTVQDRVLEQIKHFDNLIVLDK